MFYLLVHSTNRICEDSRRLPFVVLLAYCDAVRCVYWHVLQSWFTALRNCCLAFLVNFWLIFVCCHLGHLLIDDDHGRVPL